MAAGFNPNMEDLVRRMMENQQDGDSWYSGSWLDQAISGMPDLARSAWGGINDLGEQWFGGGPGDFSGQVETARKYSEDTANQYEDMIRNPVGYARDNPSATLASLAGLAAGGGGAASGLLRHGSRIGNTSIPHTPNAPDAPSTAHGITSRLSNAEESALNDDFATRLMRGDEDFFRQQAGQRIKGTDSRLGDIVDRIGRGYRDERGGTAGPDPAGDVGVAFDRGTRAPAGDLPQRAHVGRSNPHDKGKGELLTDEQVQANIEARSLDDLSPGRRAVADYLSETEWGGPKQSPTMGPQAAMELDRAIAARARARALMEGHDNTGHQTPMNAQGGAGITSIRQGRRVGGEGNPYQRDPWERRGRESINRTNQDRINEIPEERTLPGEGAASGGPASYERVRDEYGRETAESTVAEGYSGGIRELQGNPGNQHLQDLFEHETDVGNIESIRQKGIEARWDPAEGDTPRRLVSARRKGGDSEVPEGRARVIFRSSQTPMERGGLNAVKFREGISPDDIVDIIQAKKSTLGRLAEDTRRGGRELDPDFETKPKPSPSPPRKKVPPKRTPPTSPHLSTRGLSPGEMALRAHERNI